VGGRGGRGGGGAAAGAESWGNARPHEGGLLRRAGAGGGAGAHTTSGGRWGHHTRGGWPAPASINKPYQKTTGIVPTDIRATTPPPHGGGAAAPRKRRARAAAAGRHGAPAARAWPARWRPQPLLAVPGRAPSPATHHARAPAAARTDARLPAAAGVSVQERPRLVTAGGKGEGGSLRAPSARSGVAAARGRRRRWRLVAGATRVAARRSTLPPLVGGARTAATVGNGGDARATAARPPPRVGGALTARAEQWAPPPAPLARAARPSLAPVAALRPDWRTAT